MLLEVLTSFLLHLDWPEYRERERARGRERDTRAARTSPRHVEGIEREGTAGV